VVALLQVALGRSGMPRFFQTDRVTRSANRTTTRVAPTAAMMVPMLQP